MLYGIDASEELALEIQRAERGVANFIGSSNLSAVASPDTPAIIILGNSSLTANTVVVLTANAVLSGVGALNTITGGTWYGNALFAGVGRLFGFGPIGAVLPVQGVLAADGRSLFVEQVISNHWGQNNVWFINNNGNPTLITNGPRIVVAVIHTVTFNSVTTVTGVFSYNTNPPQQFVRRSQNQWNSPNGYQNNLEVWWTFIPNRVSCTVQVNLSNPAVPVVTWTNFTIAGAGADFQGYWDTNNSLPDYTRETVGTPALIEATGVSTTNPESMLFSIWASGVYGADLGGGPAAGWINIDSNLDLVDGPPTVGSSLVINQKIVPTAQINTTIIPDANSVSEPYWGLIIDAIDGLTYNPFIQGKALLAGASDLEVFTGLIDYIADAAGLFDMRGRLFSAALLIEQAIALLTSDSAFIADAHNTTSQGAALLANDSAFIADAHNPSVYGLAALTNDSSLQVDSFTDKPRVILTGVGTLDFDITHTPVGAARFTGTGALAALVSGPERFAAATFLGTGSIRSPATVLTFGAAIFAGVGTLSARTFATPWAGAALMAGNGIFLATPYDIAATSLTLNADSGNGQGFSERHVITLSKGGVLIRVKLTSGTAGPTNLDNASVGIQSTTYNTVATPIPLTLNGSHSIVVPINSSIFTDFVSLNTQPGDKVVVINDYNASVASSERFNATPDANTRRYFLNPSASFNQANPPGVWSTDQLWNLVAEVDIITDVTKTPALGNALLAGVGTCGVLATILESGLALLAGSSTLAANAVLSGTLLAGVGTLAVDGTHTAKGAAALAGAGSLAVDATSTGPTTITATGPGSMTVPAGKTTLLMEAWGGGSGGSGVGSANAPGGGGGGYSSFTATVTPGNTVFYTVGAGSAGVSNNGSAGGTSWVNPSSNAQPASNGCVAAGGGAPSGSTGTGGAGGLGTIGTTNFTGGKGCDGSDKGATHGNGGGGGGGAGSAGTGGTSTTQAHGVGGTPDGGNGADGSGGSNPPGTQPGGGGGGDWNGTGSNGGDGMVRLTFS
jgi:hypothetical protein